MQKKNAKKENFFITKKTAAKAAVIFHTNSAHTARVTFPERRQRVHTQTDLGVPFTTAFTLRIFGFHVLLERL